MAFATLVCAVAAAAVWAGLVTAASPASDSATYVPWTTWQNPQYFNMTINDTSAMWTWWPSMTGDNTGSSANASFAGDSNATNTNIWNTTFSGSNWSTYVAGDAGLGESSRTASAQYGSPQVLFNFPMTGFRILGDVDNLDYNQTVNPLQLIVDSRNPTYPVPADGVICAVGSLVWGYHKMQLSLFSGNWTIRGIEVTTGAAIDDLGRELNESAAQVETFVLDNETLNPFYTYSGDWEVEDTLGSTGNIDYKHLLGMNGAYVNVTVPSGTAFVYLNGTVGPESDQFSLDWNPLPPLADSHMLFSAYNAWEAPSLLYAIPLDPMTNYTLVIGTYAATDSNPLNGTTLGLHSMSFFQQQTTTQYLQPPEELNKGAIAGGVVGGVVGLALIIGAIVWFVRRRRRRRVQDVTHISKFDVDSPSSVELRSLTPPPQPEPFLATHTSAAQKRPGEHSDMEGEATNTGAGPSSSGRDIGTAASGALAPRQGYVGEGSSVPTSYPSSLSGTMGSSANLVPPKDDASAPVPQLAAELKHGPSALRPPRPRPVAQEEDGGTLDGYEILPPVYNPEWARARGSGPSRQQALPLSPATGVPPHRGLSVDTSRLGAARLSPTPPTPTTATTATTMSSPSADTHSPETTEHSPMYPPRQT